MGPGFSPSPPPLHGWIEWLLGEWLNTVLWLLLRAGDAVAYLVESEINAVATQRSTLLKGIIKHEWRCPHSTPSINGYLTSPSVRRLAKETRANGMGWWWLKGFPFITTIYRGFFPGSLNIIPGKSVWFDSRMIWSRHHHCSFVKRFVCCWIFRSRSKWMERWVPVGG